jgi:hypothetical protein
LVLVPQRAPTTFPYKDKPVSKKVTYQDLTVCRNRLINLRV